MKVSERLDSRRKDWQELERLCQVMERNWRMPPKPRDVSRFASLYRSACADLALADAYQLPPATIQYLHRLVGRAHNQLYRTPPLLVENWYQELFVNVPRRLYADTCLRLAFVLFWGVFLMSMFLAWRDPGFAEKVAPQSLLSHVENDFAHEPSDKQSALMAGFYIQHNATIGLRCFAFGMLAGIGGLYETMVNAAWLGTAFGRMIDSPHAMNFFHFVTAHGPFELTAIVLMAGAGMRLGFSMIDTRGRSRGESLRQAALQSVPVLATGVVLFMLAAAIEAFVSPSALPYPVKAGVAIVSTLLLLFYFVVLGYPRRRHV